MKTCCGPCEMSVDSRCLSMPWGMDSQGSLLALMFSSILRNAEITSVSCRMELLLSRRGMWMLSVGAKITLKKTSESQ